MRIIITGSASEKQLTNHLQNEIGEGCFSAGGLLNLNELTLLISKAPVMVSVNTGTVHIAAAVQTPVVVLYALTNPQHTPWMVPCKILPFSIPKKLQSKNEVIRHVHNQLYQHQVSMPSSNDILNAVSDLLNLTI